MTGLALIYWLWAKVGIRRDEVFIDNTLRCLSPKSKAGAAYPTGEAKKLAELSCRQYDRIHLFKPDCVILTIHPASLAREITPLPLCIKDWERARDFAAQGRRVLILVGGKAAQAFLRYGGNSTRWRGHFQALPGNWGETYKEAFAYQGKAKRAKKVIERPAELTDTCKSCKRYRGRTVPKIHVKPVGENMKKSDLYRRLFSKIDKKDSHWVWRGTTMENGYGTILFLAHRLTYELLRGPIPEGLVIDHTCRKRNCVNPAHMQIVTLQENNRIGNSPPLKTPERKNVSEGIYSRNQISFLINDIDLTVLLIGVEHVRSVFM